MTSGTGPEGWILQTDDGTLLPLELADSPALDANCVSIAVGDDFPDVTEQDEVVAALQQVVDDTGESLQVADFC